MCYILSFIADGVIKLDFMGLELLLLLPLRRELCEVKMITMIIRE